MAREVAEAEARRFGRAAGLLSIGIGSAGLLTYVYSSLASHNLGKVAYGELVVLSSAVFAHLDLFRRVEELLSRTIAERQANEQAMGSRCGSRRRFSSPGRRLALRPRPPGPPPGGAP